MRFDDNTYDSLLAGLFDKHPSVQKEGFSANAYKPGLEGMERFDSALGHPWGKYRTIHVAGTNGKGSVSSMLAASLASSGLRVGLYTSPHLVDFRERIKIISCSADGTGTYEMIPKESVFAFLTENELEGLSFFEITTGMAFWWFAEQNIDLAVIEVGLGGRLDSTNIISPVLSVVTSIGLDHCSMLGGTRERIASEKAGIFKPGVPAVVWGRDAETGPVFLDRADSTGCPLTFADEVRLPVSEDDFRSMLHGMDLQGPCQKTNLRTVLVALQIFFRHIPREALQALPHTALATGFRGRWERLNAKPEVICDIGHNPAALKINFERLTALKRPLIIVYGIMADKDLDGIAPLMPKGARYILAAPKTDRSLPVKELKTRLDALRPDLDTTDAPSVAEAVKLSLEYAAETQESLVYIGGSTFVVSEAISDHFKF